MIGSFAVLGRWFYVKQLGFWIPKGDRSGRLLLVRPARARHMRCWEPGRWLPHAGCTMPRARRCARELGDPRPSGRSSHWSERFRAAAVDAKQPRGVGFSMVFVLICSAGRPHRQPVPRPLTGATRTKGRNHAVLDAEPSSASQRVTMSAARSAEAREVGSCPAPPSHSMPEAEARWRAGRRLPPQLSHVPAPPGTKPAARGHRKFRLRLVGVGLRVWASVNALRGHPPMEGTLVVGVFFSSRRSSRAGPLGTPD